MFKQNPLSLIIVAFLFLVIGLVGLFEMIASDFVPNFLILGIPVFWGLLKHSKRWRTFALFFTWLEMIVSLIGIPTLIIFRGGAVIRFIGISPQRISYPMSLIPCVAIFLIALWQYKVLTSKKIEHMFISEK